MKNRNIVLSQNVLAAGLAGMFSTAALALAACRRAGPAASPFDAISHWLKKAARRPQHARGGPDPVLLALYAAIALGLMTGAIAMRRKGRGEDASAQAEADEPERRVVRRIRAGSI